MGKVLTIMLCLLCVAGGAAVGLNYDRISPHLPAFLQDIGSGPDETPIPTPTVTKTPSPAKTPTPTVTKTPTPAKTPTPTVTKTSTPAKTPTPTVTKTSTPTKTPTPTVTKTPTPTPTPTPLPEGTKEIVGTWIGSKTINLFIVKASADFRVVFRADNTARVTGVLNAPGYDNVPFDREITWSYLGSGRYRGAYGSTSIIFVVKGDVMTMTVNPYKLGLTDNKILDMDIDAELRKTAF